MGIVASDLPGGTGVLPGDGWTTSGLWTSGPGFKPETLAPFRRLAEACRTILDVGAYVGQCALAAAAANPAARVNAFEPVLPSPHGPAHHLALNPTCGRRWWRSSSAGSWPGAVPPRRARSAIVVERLPASAGIHQTIDVVSVDLDSFCEEWGFTEVDLVKMDVETWEPEVVDGIQGPLTGTRPWIVAEAIPGRPGAYARMRGAPPPRKPPVPPDAAPALTKRRPSPPASTSTTTTPVNHLAAPPCRAGAGVAQARLNLARNVPSASRPWRSARTASTTGTAASFRRNGMTADRSR